MSKKTESLGDMLLDLADQMERMMRTREIWVDTLVRRGDDRYVRVVKVKRHTVRKHTRSSHVRYYIVRR